MSQAVTIVDTLRRAGAEVTVASVSDELTVTCSRNVKLVADKRISDCAHSEYDLIALPVRLRWTMMASMCVTIVCSCKQA